MANANSTRTSNHPKLHPRSRDELSFTARNNRGGLVNWNVDHSDRENDTKSRMLGRSYFKEISRLAEYSDHDAFDAMRFALCSTKWNGGFGQEAEFSSQIAAAAIIGLRAMRNGEPAFDRDGPLDPGKEKHRRRVRQFASEQRKRQAAGNNVIPFPSSRFAKSDSHCNLAKGGKHG